MNATIDPSEFSNETDYADIAQYDLEPEVAQISTSLLDPIALEMMASANSVATETMTAPMAAEILEPMQAAMEMQTPLQTEELFEAADVVAEPETKRSGRFAKHLPHGYNYMLEGLLLGVSVFVLIRTQRSNWRYHHRSLQSSDQVA
jgi:hypothetical protein